MSTAYNRVERLAAMLMSRMPWTKKVVKKAYQRANYAVYKRDHRWDSPYVIRRFDYKGLETFYGYYDHSPESPDGRYILFHAVNPPSTTLPLPEEIAYVVVYDLKEEKEVFSCSTTSFNWQQGARAIWVDNDRFIFNDYNADADHYSARMISVTEGKVVKTFPLPVYDVRGCTAVSLNFDRLQMVRPDYGYRDRLARKGSIVLDDARDGVYSLDLQTGSSRLILTIDHLKKFQPQSSFEGALHWVNHLMISPDASKLMFLHRWMKSGRVYHRLMLAPIDGSDLRMLAGGMVSHCTWNGDQEIIAYLSETDMPGEYYRIDILSGKKSVLGLGVMDRYGDGHPSVSEGRLLFDTYPDRARMKSLYVLKPDEVMPERLGSFFESFKYLGPNRCDLHPRWGHDGRIVYFDSVHEGVRRLYALHLDED